MQIEIISIGTELLMGETINTNAAFLAQEFQTLGIDSYFQTVVGDNEKRIHEVLNLALSRSDAIITTGGLGPTPDDLSHESIASFFKVKTEKDLKVLKSIKEKFKMRGYKRMPPMNEKQAYKPKDAIWITNKLGTANGIIWKVKYNNSEKIIFTFPGVPSEMKQMWSDTAKKYLEKKLSGFTIYSKILKYTGIGESALAEKIKPYFNQKNPSVAPYASLGEIKIRVAAKAKNKKEAKALVEKTAKKIELKTKKYLFGYNNDSLEGLLAKILISQKLTLSCAESCTGGLLTKRLTDISGSSKYLKMSVITYSNEAKKDLINVSENTLEKYGAVSKQTAKEMAKGIKEKANSNIGISITGVAGPDGGSKEKPVGLVYFGFAYKDKVKTEKKLFGDKLSRSAIRLLSTQFLLNWIREELT